MDVDVRLGVHRPGQDDGTAATFAVARLFLIFKFISLLKKKSLICLCFCLLVSFGDIGMLQPEKTAGTAISFTTM